MGFKIRLITLDAGFYTVDVINFISQFKYIIAVPVGDVKVYEEFDGDYKTNSKRHRRFFTISSLVIPFTCGIKASKSILHLYLVVAVA